MSDPFDTLAAAEAMESVGVEPRQARVIAAQLHAAASAGDAVTRPEMGVALASLKTKLLDRMVESERALLDRMGKSERGLLDRMAESERRTAALLWRMFGAMVAVAGLAVAVIRYLP